MPTSHTSYVYLVCLEFIDEAEAFLRHFRLELAENPDNFHIVSFHPSVKSFLLQRGLPSTDSFHYCPTRSHQTLLTILEDLTGKIRSRCFIEDEVGVKESYVENFLFAFRPLVTHWLYRVEVIANVIEAVQPKVLVAVGTKEPYAERSMWVESSERYIADILAQFSETQGLALVPVGVVVRSQYWPRWWDRISKRVISELLWRIIPKVTRLKAPTVMAPSVGHSMARVLETLKKELGDAYEAAVFDLSVPHALEYCRKKFLERKEQSYTYFPCPVGRPVAQSKAFRRQKKDFRENLFDILKRFDYRDVRMTWLAAKYDRGLAPELIDKTHTESLRLNQFLDEFRPAFVLSQYCRLLTDPLSRLCRIKNIPSMMIPHGSFTASPDEYSKKEWKENALGIVDTPFHYLAMQTPLMEGFLQQLSVQSQPVITGPLILGVPPRSRMASLDLRRRFAKDHERIIMHAGTPKHRRAQRLLNYETIDEYVDNIRLLIEAVRKIPDTHLVVRYRIIDGLTDAELKSLLPQTSCYSIASDMTFMDYLLISDLLVSYSSSTMEEALQNNIPVLQFNPHNRYRHIQGLEISGKASGLTPAPVYNTNDLKDLEFALNWIAQNHLNRKNSLNHLFDKYKYKDTIRLSQFIQESVRNGRDRSVR